MIDHNSRHIGVITHLQIVPEFKTFFQRFYNSDEQVLEGYQDTKIPQVISSAVITVLVVSKYSTFVDFIFAVSEPKNEHLKRSETLQN